MRYRVNCLLAAFLVVAIAFQCGLSAGPAMACEETDVSAAGTWATGFKDVPPEHWAYSAVIWMAENGILAGVGDGRFAPEAPVTREQFAKIMVLALRLQMAGDYVPSFGDVPRGSWAFRYVEAAKAYLTGWRVDGGQMDVFRPGSLAVREDMAVALVKALGLAEEEPDFSQLDQFGDADAISANLRRHVALAIAHGIMQGSPGDGGERVFLPQGALSRAQAAVLVFNAIAQAGEKVTYDATPVKVTYEQPGTGQGTPAVTLNAGENGGLTVLNWTAASGERFAGYKVVLSRGDSTPEYPANGYLVYITGRAETSVVLRPGASYSGSNDLGGKLELGSDYYACITVLYAGGERANSNVIRVTIR